MCRISHLDLRPPLEQSPASISIWLLNSQKTCRCITNCGLFVGRPMEIVKAKDKRNWSFPLGCVMQPTSTGYHLEEACLPYEMSCGSQPMIKSVFYPFGTRLIAIRRLVRPRRGIRTKNLESNSRDSRHLLRLCYRIILHCKCVFMLRGAVEESASFCVRPGVRKWSTKFRKS